MQILLVYLCHTKIVEMGETLLITLLILAISLVLLSLKIVLTKDGRFPNSHVSGNPALKKEGVGCVQSQDREAQTSSPFAVDERANK